MKQPGEECVQAVRNNASQAEQHVQHVQHGVVMHHWHLHVPVSGRSAVTFRVKAITGVLVTRIRSDSCMHHRNILYH